MSAVEITLLAVMLAGFSGVIAVPIWLQRRRNKVDIANKADTQAVNDAQINAAVALLKQQRDDLQLRLSALEIQYARKLKELEGVYSDRVRDLETVTRLEEQVASLRREITTLYARLGQIEP